MKNFKSKISTRLKAFSNVVVHAETANNNTKARLILPISTSAIYT
jgi:hypothetical protein